MFLFLHLSNAETINTTCVWGEPLSGNVNPFACYIREMITLNSDDTLNVLSDMNANEIIEVHFWFSWTMQKEWLIYRIPIEVFKKFPNLKSFTLPGHVDTINATDFTDATNLEYLKVSNSIRIINERTFLSTPKLEKLDLSGNKINAIAANAFDDLMHLKYLHLDRNRLMYINQSTFVGIENLLVLTLSFNKIDHIENDALNFPHLIEINLSHNKLRTLSDMTFHQCIKLQNIQLKSNVLHSIGQAFYHLKYLQHVNLDRNHIVDIRLDEFAILPHLEYLSLQHCFGYPFDSVVENLATVKPNVKSELRELLLAGNRLKSRKILNILHHFGFSNLEKLDLDNNDFSEIDFTDIELLPRLKQINLGANHWKCEWLNDTVQHFEDENIGINLYSSHFPLSENGKNINYIQCT